MLKKTYKVSGTHCSSCEILIKTRLKNQSGVENVELLPKNAGITVTYKAGEIPLADINKLFEDEKYEFYDGSLKIDDPKNSLIEPLILAIVILFGLYVLNDSGFASSFSINKESGLAALSVFGLVAGFSSCGFLVGSLLLSISKFWEQNKVRSIVLFIVGRLASFTFLGGLLGLMGKGISISPTIYSVFSILVSLFMIYFALKMVGVKLSILRLSNRLSGSTQKMFSMSQSKFALMPLIIGALTFLLPCGFTFTAESISLVSGNFSSGALILLAFALGTTPALFLIGIGGTYLNKTSILSKTVAILIIFFAGYNIYGVFTAVDLSHEVPTSNPSKEVQGSTTQVIKMNANSRGFSPNYFKVKLGNNIRWEITDTGTSGCTNAVVARGLFEGQVNLTQGQTSAVEFTPQSAGKYKFSCWMGMVSGTIEVVDE